MKYKAVVELEVELGPVEPTHREEYKLFKGLANAVNHAIADEIPYHEALEGVAVVKVRIPAAAGEGETARITVLNEEQRALVRDLVRARLRQDATVLEATLDHLVNVAYVRFTFDGKEQWLPVLLLEGDLR